MNRKMIFLLVDDDADDLMFFCEVVKELEPPHECLTAENGEEALKILRSGMKQLPDFIFLDLNMPKMDGRACLTILKRDERLKDIPVVIFSPSSYQKDIDETRALGAAFFLTKPTDFQKLKNEIAAILTCSFLKAVTALPIITAM